METSRPVTIWQELSALDWLYVIPLELATESLQTNLTGLAR